MDEALQRAPERTNHRINCVAFAAAEAFCAYQPPYPTEAEWELAARGVEGRTYPWGPDAPECGRACYDKNGTCRAGGESVATCAAGLHVADRTPDGVYNLGGGVSEWVGGGDPLKRVARGANFARPGRAPPGLDAPRASGATAHATIGFRCAMDGPGVPGTAPPSAPPDAAAP